MTPNHMSRSLALHHRPTIYLEAITTTGGVTQIMSIGIRKSSIEIQWINLKFVNNRWINSDHTKSILPGAIRADFDGKC